MGAARPVVFSLSPLYSANFPKTEAEVEALKRLTADPNLKVLTFGDGKEYKGIAQILRSNTVAPIVIIITSTASGTMSRRTI